jgi:hypothetical protein
MTYDEFKYIYPPRPQFKIPPKDLERYETGEYQAQIKYNGSACVVFTNGEQLHVYNRHKQPLAKYSPFIPFKSLSPDGKWYVYAGEYLNKGQKGEQGGIERDKFVIWDCLVYAGEYLVGKTFAERMTLVDVRYPCLGMRVNENKLESYDYMCATSIEGIYKSPTYVAGFDFLYDDLIKTPLYEGVVLKKKDAKLTYGFQEKNNSEWQLKCRKENKLYKF